MDEETIILRDMIEKRPCRIDMERRNQLVARFGHPEAFTRDGLKDEYIIDYATGIRTRRTLDERIIWKFDPSDQLLSELKTLCGHQPQPSPVVNANIVSIAPEALAQISTAVHEPANPTAYSEIIPVVRQVYTDDRLAKLRQKLKQRKLSLRGAALYVYNEPKPMEHLYPNVIDARMKLKRIIDENLKFDPDAAAKAIASLAQQSKQSHNKKQRQKKRSSAPAPVPILGGYFGNN